MKFFLLLYYSGKKKRKRTITALKPSRENSRFRRPRGKSCLLLPPRNGGRFFPRSQHRLTFGSNLGGYVISLRHVIDTRAGVSAREEEARVVFDHFREAVLRTDRGQVTPLQQQKGEPR